MQEAAQWSICIIALWVKMTVLQFPRHLAELYWILWVSHDSADIVVVVILPQEKASLSLAYLENELPEVSQSRGEMLSYSASLSNWHLGQPGVTGRHKSFCAETQNPSKSSLKMPKPHVGKTVNWRVSTDIIAAKIKSSSYYNWSWGEHECI